jgi:hypothetical protein
MSVPEPAAAAIRDRIATVIGDVALADDLMNSVQRSSGSTVGSVLSVDDRFREALDAARVDVQQDPRGQLLASLLQDDAELTNEQVIRCLRFIYWHMINTFQGDLAELLAMGTVSECIADWASEGLLPSDAQTIWGRAVRMRSAKRPTGWLKGADAVVVSADDRRLIIHAAVEIKSYPVSQARAGRQLRSHLRRFGGGVKIGSRAWHPSEISFASRPTGDQAAAVDPNVLQLVVMPQVAAGSPGPSRRVLGPSVFAATLPWTAARLANAAYCMTAWFLGQVGQIAFQSGSPWPNLALAEAGLNAAKQAFYYVLLRPGLPAREQYIATRLYNVYGFGYAASSGHREILWPAPALIGTPHAAEIADRIESAWGHYRRCRMDKAQREIDAAEALSLDEQQSRRLQWLRGMILYFMGDLAAAAQVIPQPQAEEDPGKWAKDKLTIARLAARLGHVEQAERELTAVAARSLPHRFIPIGIGTVRALIALSENLHDEAKRIMDVTANALIRERADLDERQQQGKGVPASYGLDPSTVSALAVDLLPTAVGLRDFATAATLLNTVEGLFAPYLLLLRDDAWLAPLREHPDIGPKLLSWIAEDWPGEEPA